MLYNHCKHATLSQCNLRLVASTLIVMKRRYLLSCLLCVMLNRHLVPLLLFLLQLRMVPLPLPPLRTQQHASAAAAVAAGIWNVAFAQHTCAFSYTHR
jgi:hypothetical protein